MKCHRLFKPKISKVKRGFVVENPSQYAARPPENNRIIIKNNGNKIISIIRPLRFIDFIDATMLRPILSP